MATAKKISGLTAVVTPAGSDTLAVKQGSTTKKLTVTQLLTLQDATPAEVNDLSAAVTWDDIPDANVPESAVTQHEAALAIAASQLSDLAIISQANAEAGVATDAELWTAQRVAQAIAALAASGGQLIMKPADESRSTNQTFTDDDTMVGFTTTEAKWYRITAFLRYTQGGGHFKFKFLADQTPQSINFRTVTGNTSTTHLSNLSVNDTYTQTGVASGTETYMTIDGFIQTHATIAGTLDLQWNRSTASATTILRAGSWVKLEEIA